MNTKIVTPKHRYHLDPIIELVDTEVEPEALVNDLEEADWDLSQYCLKDEENCGMPWIAERRYRLRLLKEALSKMLENKK